MRIGHVEQLHYKRWLGRSQSRMRLVCGVDSFALRAVLCGASALSAGGSSLAVRAEKSLPLEPRADRGLARRRAFAVPAATGADTPARPEQFLEAVLHPSWSTRAAMRGCQRDAPSV